MNDYIDWKDTSLPAKQGDLMLISIEALPEGVVAQKNDNGYFVLAHSETGHHHAVLADNDVEFYADPKDDMKSYFVVKKVIGSLLEHMRSFDTHKSIKIPPGIYELRRQREYTPQGWRKVED